jgi:hypothetical protein
MSAFSPLSFCSEARNSFSLPTLACHIIEEWNLVRNHSMRSDNLGKGYFFIKEVMFHISLLIFIFHHVLRSPVTNECKKNIWLKIKKVGCSTFFNSILCAIEKNIMQIINHPMVTSSDGIKTTGNRNGNFLLQQISNFKNYTLTWRKLIFTFSITWPCYAPKLVAIIPAILETQEWREDPQGGKHKAPILHKHANPNLTGEK